MRESSTARASVPEPVAASVAPHPRWGVLLRQRDFRLFWFGETTSRCGSAVTTVAMPLIAVSTLHAGTFTIGVLEAAIWLPWLLIGLPAGAWVDRLARRPVMLACNAVSALLFASIPFAARLGVLHIGQLVVVAFLAGTSAVFFRVAFQAYLPTVVAPEHLAEGNAKLHGSSSAAEVVGPSVGGVLAQALGPVTALLADVLSFAVSTTCLLGIRAREPHDRPRKRDTDLAQQIAEGLRHVTADPYLRALAAFGACGNMMLVAVQTLLVVFLVRVVGLASGMVGLVVASIGVGGILGALAVRPVIRRFGTARGLLTCAAGTAPFALLIPLTGKGLRLVPFVVGGVVMAAGIVVCNVIASSFRQAYCPRHLLGRVSATMTVLVFGSMPLGALLGGGLATLLGVREALFVCTGLLTPPVLILLCSPIRGRRDLPTVHSG